jgi:hypothetical protein
MIRYVLIALFLIGLAYVFVLSKGDRPGRKIGILVLVALAITFILVPDLTNQLANFMGVGRGTDLIVYFFIPVTLFACINLYIREKQLEQRIFRLTSELAILAHDVERLSRGR